MDQKEEFAARMARVRANNGRSLIMVGSDETHVREAKVSVQVSRKREILGNLVFPMSLLGALVLGAIAVVLGQYARFHLFNEPAVADDSTIDFMVAGSLGIALGFVLTQMFRLTSKEHRGMQTVGVFLMVCMFHNLSHWLPGPMSVAFSPEWTERVRLNKPANTFYFRGVYFPLIEGDFAGSSPADSDLAAQGCVGAKPAVKSIVDDGGQAGGATAFKRVEAKTAASADDCATE